MLFRSVWDIPLHTRRGVGYVHSTAFIDLEEAEREIRSYEGPHAGALETRIVERLTDYMHGMLAGSRKQTIPPFHP